MYVGYQKKFFYPPPPQNSYTVPTGLERAWLSVVCHSTQSFICGIMAQSLPKFRLNVITLISIFQIKLLIGLVFDIIYNDVQLYKSGQYM